MTKDVMDLSYKPDAIDKFVAAVLVGLGVFVWILLWQIYLEALVMEVALGLFFAGAASVCMGLFVGLRGRLARSIARGPLVIFIALFGIEVLRLWIDTVLSWL